jgi:hypothetical protein
VAPRINDNILNCGIYLYESEQDAKQGVKFGGSGFLVGIPFTNGWERRWHCYAVTAAHVVEEGCPVVRVNTNRPNLKATTVAFPLTQNDWIPHRGGDDIAVAPINLDRSLHRYMLITPTYDMRDFFINEQIQEDTALGAGDEVFMVGRFLARDESVRNAPIVRFGHMASAEVETVHQETRDFLQESFLVEVHSISGSSGSPVFVNIPLYRVKEERKRTSGNPLTTVVRGVARQLQHHTFLLGVDWGHLDEHNFPGMAGVVPAWKLTDILNYDELRYMRTEEERRIAKQRKRGATLDLRGKGQLSKAGIEIPIPSKAKVMDVFKKATRKRDKK